MVIMAEVANEIPIQKFTDSNRAGRRNALPDVLSIDEKADADTIARKLDQLSIDSGPGNQGNSSDSNQNSTKDKLTSGKDKAEGGPS